MANRTRCLVAALLMLIALPARGQDAAEFDRHKVVALWRLVAASARSGRVEWVGESWMSRDGAPLEHRRTDTGWRAFNANGSAFAFTLEEYGKTPLRLNSLTIANEKYQATLRKPKGKEGWVLTDSKLAGKDQEPGEKQFPVWLRCGNVFLPDWIEDPGFIIARTERSAGALVRVQFKNDVSKRKSSEFPEHIESGYIDFDPGHSYCPVSYEYRVATKHSQETSRGDREYEFDGEIPLLKSKVTNTTAKGERFGLIKGNSKWTYKTQYNVHVADDEFRLSFYGLPEPIGVEWPKPTRWWLWIMLAAAGCLALAVLLRTLKRRYQTSATARATSEKKVG